jgi:uncharacterized membrane protein YfcA
MPELSVDFLLSNLPFIGAVLGASVVAGLLAGLLGVGGGIVIVPVLFQLLSFMDVPLEIRMHVAVATSLLAIIPTAISSARSHHRKTGLDFTLLKNWGPFLFAGALTGGALSYALKGQVLTAIFAVMTLLIACNMALRPEGHKVRDRLPGSIASRVIAFFIGGFSAVMGIGGGTLAVPVLSACAYPIRKAVANAAFFGVLIAIPGVCGFIISGLEVAGRPFGSLGYANLVCFALIVPVTMFTAPIGAKIAHTIAPSALKKAFAVFLFLTSARMWISVLGL